ncbi:hypothetical protein HGP28_15160 [Vibrio sp. SM6]|uniref:ATP-binding protein n=1 Tax=Vibrio agarilyticus TaxID=2726741 RepID=A0A7X8TSY7_9VIBR|nr:hypothetical protein [Vibrio agarilyticus]NLS14224.1 hypothetical protein [Vibrio agarilyticus]
MKHLYIVRGPFGTGKTEFAKSLSENVISCWDYYAQYGENKWNEKLKPHADEYCRNSVLNLMKKNECKIFVTNSFSKNSDLSYYYELAEVHGYKVFSLVMDCRDTESYKRDAPQDVILKQIINIKNNVPFHQGF